MTVDRELWQRARSLFDELVDLESGARRARLNEVGGRDPALSDAVARLLEADADAEGALRGYSFGSADPTGPTATDSRDPLGIVGKTVSHFAVREYLAAGGMGVVYAAEDLQLGRVVALKFPLPHQRLDPSVGSRFVQEARSAAALDHPNLCPVHEIGESAHGVFLAMPLYPGETLKARLAREGALPPQEAIRVLRQLLAGLAAAHAAGIVHRDLKPGNVMLLPDGTVRILDFGLAKVKDVSQTRSGVTLGTLAFMAPEQILHRSVDARTDLWAVGVMLCEMLTGRAPFGDEHELSILHSVLHDAPPLPSEVDGTVPAHFDVLVAGLLQKDPARRYPSADALLADVNAVERGAAPAHRTPFWSRTPARRRVRRIAVPVSMALAAAAALGLVVWYGLGRGSPTPASRQPALRFVGNTATISSSAELVAALDPAYAGRRIHLRAGTYEVQQPLAVPDGMTIEGEGVMLLDASGHPMGFRGGTRTLLQMTRNVGGEMLTLGDRVTLRNLEIADLADRSGNVIRVFSRRAHDRVTVTISDVVVVNPNPQVVAGSGQLGATLRILTQNPNMGADPPPHDGALLTVRVSRSLFRVTAGGVGWFAFNFAPNSRIALELSHNVIGGENIANGGVSRPDAVHDSEVRIASDSNVYRDEWDDPCASPLTAWNLIGGSGAPVPMPRLAATVRNTLRVRSVGDRFERFTTAVFATGSRRFFGGALNAAPADNRIELRLLGATLATASCAGAPATTDLKLSGAWTASDDVVPGRGNTVRVELRDVTGSGTRANLYADLTVATTVRAAAAGRRSTAGQGIGAGSPASNRLLVVGDPLAFARDNRGIAPAPPAWSFSRP